MSVEGIKASFELTDDILYLDPIDIPVAIAKAKTIGRKTYIR